MRFQLTYDGSLRSAGNRGKLPEKWHVRRHVQPQLAELWSVHPALRDYLEPLKEEAYQKPGVDPRYSGSIERHGAHFLPLVRDSLLLVCSLDILFLRKGAPGSARDPAGDLDGRVKTVLDGLRMPFDPTEVVAGGEIAPQPFHCLLEDDRLISGLAVRTDRLLTKPGSDADQVRLVIDVRVTPHRIAVDRNVGFTSD